MPRVKMKGMPDINFPDNMTQEQILEIMRSNIQDNTLQEAAGLPMDPVSVQARGEAWGGEDTWYSGSTHDIKEFRTEGSSSEGDWGQATYASDSIDDVNANYAGQGPDLTGRIARQSELNADNMQYNGEVKDMMADLEDDPAFGDYLQGENTNYYDLMEELEAGDESASIEMLSEFQARQELMGENKGVVYPLKINQDNYAQIGGDKPTMLEGADFQQRAIDEGEIKRADYDEEWEYNDAITERAGELEDISPEDGLRGRVTQAIQDLRDDGAYIHEADEVELMEALHENFMEGELDLTELDYWIRDKIPEADIEGEPVSGGGLSASVLKSLGYDGVIDNNAGNKFGPGRQRGAGMEGMSEDTRHIITFPGSENKIRSTYAKFDPRNASSKDITASLAPFAVALGLGTGSQESEAGVAGKIARELVSPERLVKLGYIQPEAINDPKRIQAGTTRYVNNADKSPAFLKREIMHSENPLVIKQRDMPQGRIATPESLVGRTGVPVVGDRSTTGIDVNGVRVEGGARYPQEHEGTGDAWASMRDAANKKQRNFVLARDEQGQDVTGVYTQMGPDAINFSTPISEYLLAGTQAGGTTKAQRRAMDKRLRNPTKGGKKLWPGVGGKIDHPDKAKRGWVGLDHPDAMDQIMGRNGYPNIGNRRTWFAKTVGSKAAEAQGFPVWNEIAQAATEKALGMSEETIGQSGFQMFDANPDAPTHQVSRHQTYDTAIPGEYAGGLEEQLPPEVMFPQTWADLSAARSKTGKPLTRAQKTGSFMMNPKLMENFDDRWLQGVRKYQETGEIPGGYKGNYDNITSREAAYKAIPNNEQRGSADPRLLAGVAGVGGLAALGASPESEAGVGKAAKALGYDKQLYHGTLSPDVDDIDMNRVDLGLHMGTAEQANKRVDKLASDREYELKYPELENRGEYDDAPADLAANVMPLNYKQGNTLQMPDVGRWDNAAVVMDALRNGEDPALRAWANEQVPHIQSDSVGWEDNAEWIASPENREWLDEINSKMQSTGYDTVKYKNEVENAYGNTADFREGQWEADNAAAKEKNAIYDAAMAREPDPKGDALRELMNDPDVTTEMINEVMDGDWPARGPKYTPEEAARTAELEQQRGDIASQRREDAYSHIALDPANVRSEYAEFNPLNEGKSGLMGGLGALAVGGAAATGSQDAEARSPFNQANLADIPIGTPAATRTPETERADRANQELDIRRAADFQEYMRNPRTFTGDMRGLKVGAEAIGRSMGGMALGGLHAIWQMAGGADINQAIQSIEEMNAWAMEGFDPNIVEQYDMASMMERTGQNARAAFGDKAVDLYNTGFEQAGDATAEFGAEQGYPRAGAAAGAAIRGLEMLSPI